MGNITCCAGPATPHVLRDTIGTDEFDRPASVRIAQSTEARVCFPVGGVGGLEVVASPPPSQEQSDWLTVNFPEYGTSALLNRLGFVSFDAFTAHCVGELLRSRLLGPWPCIVLTLFWPRSLCTPRSLALLSCCLAEVARYKAIVEPLLNRRCWFARLRQLSSAARCQLHDLADATSGVAVARVGFPEESLIHQLAELEVDLCLMYYQVRQDHIVPMNGLIPAICLSTARFGGTFRPDAPSQSHTLTCQLAGSTRLV